MEMMSVAGTVKVMEMMSVAATVKVVEMSVVGTMKVVGMMSMVRMDKYDGDEGGGENEHDGDGCVW